MCGTLKQVVKADPSNGFNLQGGRAWSGYCNTNSNELEMAGRGIPKAVPWNSNSSKAVPCMSTLYFLAWETAK